MSNTNIFHHCQKRWRLLILALIIGVFSLAAQAGYHHTPVRLIQPNGKVWHAFATDDSNRNGLFDAKGRAIIRHPGTGYYVYADTVDPSLAVAMGAVSSRAGRTLVQSAQAQGGGGSAYGVLYPMPKLGKMPTLGTVNNLVIFIRFAGESEYNIQLSPYDALFNNSSPSAYSLHNFLADNSYSKLQVNTSFYPAASNGRVVSYADSYPRAYYSPYHSTYNPIGYKDEEERWAREQLLLMNAVTAVAADVPPSLNIDADNDGLVDNITFIVTGGPDNWNSLFWPHQNALLLQTAKINNSTVYTYNFMLNDWLENYAIVHETLHSLGLPDLYPYYGMGNTSLEPVGPWDIMGEYTQAPQQTGAYLKYKYGKWIDSLPVITASGTYTLNPVTSPTNNCYRINSPNSNNEFFVVEYRAQAGKYDITLPGSGLLVYRIRADQLGNYYSPADEVYLYRPGGTRTSVGNVNTAFFSSQSGRTAINDTTNPSSFLSDGSRGGLNISRIGSAGSTISFTVTITGSSVVYQPDLSICNAGETSYIGNGVYNLASAQTKTQTVKTGVTATYQLRLDNDGTQSDTLYLVGDADGDGWTVRYFDALTGGNDITQAVTHNGYTFTGVAQGASRDIRVEVTPTSAVSTVTTKSVGISAVSGGDQSRIDQVFAVTTLDNAQPPPPPPPPPSGTICWKSAVSGNWNDATKWDAGRVPASSDQVAITVAGTYTVTMTGNVTVAGLMLGGSSGKQTLAAGNYALQVTETGSVQTSGQINVNGTFGGGGAITVLGTLNWQNGTIGTPAGTGWNTAAVLQIGAGGKLIIGSSSTKVLRQTLQSAGTITVNGTGYIGLETGSVLQNQAGGVIDLTTNMVWYGSGRLVNLGTCRKSAGTGLAGFAFPDFTNSGTVEVLAGQLAVGSGGKFTQEAAAVLSLATGARFDALSDGTITFKPGAAQTGTGIIRLTSGALLYSGEVTIPTIEITGGLLGGSNGSILHGKITWSDGYIGIYTGTGWDTTASTTLASGSELIVAGTGRKVLGQTLLNAGTVRVTGTGQLLHDTTGILRNQAGALVDIQADMTWGGYGRIYNEGTFRKSAGTGTTTVSIPFTNTGTVQILSGQLLFTGGG